jgi:protein TonB
MSTSLQIPALACSVALHTGIIALGLCQFSASFPQQQVVDIEVVKISSLEPAHEKQAATTATPGESVMPKPVSPLGMEPPAKPVKPHQSKVAALPTSGPQSPKATKQVAAVVEPLFSAAYLHNTPPSYPDSARRDGVEGKVLLKITVGKDGDAQAVDIAHSSGHEELDSAAQKAVKSWHFVPARRGDETLESNVIVPIEFKLE